MIRLQFVLGQNWSSRIIAYWGNGYGGYSHVDAILKSGELLGARDDVIKPLGGGPIVLPGVQVRPPYYERWVRRCVVEIDATPQQEKHWERWLRSQVGRQYDSGSIWGFILGREMHHKGQWICSALQSEALELIGKFGQIPTPPAQITPNSLLIAATAMGGVAKAA